MSSISVLPGRRAAAVLLVAAPACELVETLVSPLHDGSTASEMGRIATHQGAFVVSVLFGMIAVLLFTPAFLGLADACFSRSPKLARVAGWVAAASMTGFFGVRGIQAVQLAMVRDGLDHRTGGRIIDHASSNPLGALVLVVFLLGSVVGTVALAAAAWRAGLPRIAAVLLVLFPFVDNGVSGHLGTLVAHVMLLVSLTWFATALWSRDPARESVPEPVLTA
jgi:di/tricarboxylate transporter